MTNEAPNYVFFFCLSFIRAAFLLFSFCLFPLAFIFVTLPIIAWSYWRLTQRPMDSIVDSSYFALYSYEVND